VVETPTAEFAILHNGRSKEASQQPIDGTRGLESEGLDRASAFRSTVRSRMEADAG
jgi:hypothetical protein